MAASSKSRGNGSAAESERDKAIALAVSTIEKQFGKGAILTMSEDGVDREAESFSSGSPSIDLALGIGGYPRGRVVEIFGPESSGKTTLALHAIAEVQRRGGVAAFVDAEHALDIGYARRLGVQVDDLLVSQPDTRRAGARDRRRAACARARSTSSWSTRWRRWCRAPRSRARWATSTWGCRRV